MDIGGRIMKLYELLKKICIVDFIRLYVEDEEKEIMRAGDVPEKYFNYNCILISLYIEYVERYKAEEPVMHIHIRKEEVK